MACLLTPERPWQDNCPATAPERTAGLARVRLGLQMLTLRLASGAQGEPIALALRDLFKRELAPLHDAPAADRIRMATAFLGGVCSLARWQEPSRTAQAVAPLGVVVWHVGRALESRDPMTLWIDFVLPDDERRVPATEWARDIRLLLMQAGVPHRAETALVPAAPTVHGPTGSAPQDLGMWGCNSLLHAYRCTGETSRRPAL